MKEVAELVLLHRPDVFGHDAIRRKVAHLERVGVEVLPVFDRDAARIEQLDVRAKGAARVSDRLVARRARRDTSAQHRHVCEPVAAFALNVYRGSLHHALDQSPGCAGEMRSWLAVSLVTATPLL